MAEQRGRSVLDLNSCLELVRVNGFSGEYSNALVPSVNGKEAFFISAANIVAMDMSTQKQRFFLGHTATVTTFAFSGMTAHYFYHHSRLSIGSRICMQLLCSIMRISSSMLPGLWEPPLLQECQ
jgi:hypothetical protein